MQFLRNRGEPDQVVHDNVHRTANTVGRDVRKIECLGKYTLSGECAIAMDQQWQKLLASAFACAVLLCASAAHGDWINRLKMARVRNQMDMYLRAAAGFVFARCAHVILDVAAAKHAPRINIFES